MADKEKEKNLPKTCSLRQAQYIAISSLYFPVDCFDCAQHKEIIKSRLVKLYPTKPQRETFHYWLRVSRFVFNWTINFIRSCVNWTPNWMEIKKYATQILPEWTKSCPFQIKGIAIKEAVNAFFKAKGRPKFRSRKQPEQSCFIPNSAIK
jgi:putative transposase